MVTDWDSFVFQVRQMVMPVMVLALFNAAQISRFMRASMLDNLNQDYVRTARAKGLDQNLIIRRHALRNALLPVITIIGIEFAFLMGGLVVTEQVFNLNGLGKLFVESVENHDYNMTQALVMLVVGIFALTNLVVDIVYAWLDPRIRYNR